MNSEIEARLEQMENDVYSRLSAATARMDDTVEKLAPITREAAKRAQIEALEAQGKVVKDKKGALESGTVWSGMGGAVAAFYAALELLPGAMTTGEWDTFGAAAGAFLTALTAIYRRWRVGDLRILP